MTNVSGGTFCGGVVGKRDFFVEGLRRRKVARSSITVSCTSRRGWSFERNNFASAGNLSAVAGCKVVRPSPAYSPCLRKFQGNDN